MSPKTLPSVANVTREIFPKLGISTKTSNPGAFWGEWGSRGPILEKYTPIDGTLLATVREASPADYERVVSAAHAAFPSWRELPAPRRGEVVRRYGNALRSVKRELGLLVSL